MVAKPFPSGNPQADRRAGYAETMAYLGDLTVAIEVLSGALDLAPDWAAGWFRLGEYYESARAMDEAAGAWRRALALDPDDTFGAGLKLDLMRDVPVAERMPAAYVELLFDQYAPRFEASLLKGLEYRGPELVIQALRDAGFARARRALDLGCGTGLMGVALRDSCDWLGGCDISGRMLEEAEAKGIYDRLDKHDLGTLAPEAETHDLIVAADVFIYLGALEQIVGWCAGALMPRGWFAFTLERGERPVELRSSRRFAHSEAYVREVLEHAGFAEINLRDCVLRQDRGEDVRGLCVVASRHGAATRLDRDDQEHVPA